MDLLFLKSGSDVRGAAMEHEGNAVELTEDIAGKIGYAFALHTKKPGAQIALGRDSRLSGESLLLAVARGIKVAGCEPIDMGLATTPSMYMAIREMADIDASIMVTASHMPYYMNGLKFFTGHGGFSGKEVEALLLMAERAPAVDSDYVPPKKDILPVYSGALIKKLREITQEEMPFSGMHVALDAGNGAGGFFAGVLEKLGANTKGSVFLEPDGMFPHHVPNPEDKEAMRSIACATTEAGADYGIVLDTDCDRAAMVDAGGNPIADNRLIAVIASILLLEKPGATIVTDSVTSTALMEFIENHGGKQRRFRRGYKNVIDEARRLMAEGIYCPLAIETSGHAALLENDFLDDGAYLSLRLLCEAKRRKEKGQTLSDAIKDLRMPKEVINVRIPILDKNFIATGNAILDALTDFALLKPDFHIVADNIEGIRVHFHQKGVENSAWMLLRLSLHEPNMPLHIESDIEGGATEVLGKLYEFLKTCPGVSLDGVKKYL